MSEPRVKVEGGILEGYSCENQADPQKSYYCFQGIPYGQAPVGELRFKAPQPAEPWTGVKMAKEDGDQCYAKDWIDPKQNSGSEDCLNLNVYTPKLPSKTNTAVNYDLKPVMVYIHGGAYTSGSNSKYMYGPDFLIREDVVIVTINYRLGFLGFLYFEDKSLGIPGNQGLKDMVIALRWVKNNIKNFNGDPNNITIFGESAGGVSVHLLVLSPMAKGLFHKAIAQSGTALNLWAQGANISSSIASKLKMDGANEATLLKKLKEMKVEELYALQASFPDPWDASTKRFLGFAIEDPNQDEEPFLTEHPMVILERGTYNHVPTMMGFTSREGMLVHDGRNKKFRKITPNIENLVPYYFDLPKGTPSSKLVVQKIMKYYFNGQDPDEADVDLCFKLYSDNFFIREIYRSVATQSRSSSKSVYLYEMTIETSLNIFKKMLGIESPGVSHGDDIFYLFKTLLNHDIVPDSIEDKAVRRFSKLWTNFAKYGNPNSPLRDPLLTVTWQPFTNKSKSYLQIGEDLKAGTEPVKERIEFWEDLYNRRNDTNSKL